MAMVYVSHKGRILLFIHIFIKLITAEIQFNRAKALPLILHACYYKGKSFKDFCETFIDYFAIQYTVWNQDGLKLTAPVIGPDGKLKSKYIRYQTQCKTLHHNYLNVYNKYNHSYNNLKMLKS